MAQIEHGNFLFSTTSIEGLLIVEPKCFEDNRGYFLESYKKTDFASAGIKCDFLQDNQSFSRKHVLRGLHYQIKHPQSKLVRVLSGEVFDVAVDLRPGSVTYGKWESVVLSEENRKQFFIPRGFAHGFYVLSEAALVCYKCDDVYHPHDEGGILWSDPELGIEWPELAYKDAVLSDRDQRHPLFGGSCRLTL